MADKSYWDATRKILVVIKFKSLDNIHEYRAAIKSLQLNVNDCSIIAMVATKKEKNMLTEIHSVVYASEQEINLLGNWKNEDLNKALKQFFDAVIVVGEHSNKTLKYIRRVKNSISVGINTNADFLTVCLTSEETSPGHLLNFAKRTLEKII